MRNKIAIAAIALLCSCTAQKDPMDAFIDDLMGKMTLHEKIGQLNQQVGGDIVTGSAQDTEVGALAAAGELGSVLNVKGIESINALQKVAVENSRLGIPILFGMDVIHGYETIFPIPLGLASTWDLEGIEQSARIAAKEASANGIAWTFSPMVDICVDPRWGRQAEGAGEDPYLGSTIAKAMVKGYQGADRMQFAEDEIMACIKHFALYGAAEAGRDYNTVDMSHMRMFNQYFPPYQAAVEAGAGSVMSSFNIVDGIPATANRWLLTEVLRERWGFDGFVVTDYASIDEMQQHGMGDKQHNAALALKAGTDMDMVARGFIETLEKSVQDGLVSEKDIDQACRRVLEAKYKLGLFDDPYKYSKAERAEGSTCLPEYRETAKNLTAESFVLLKNEGNLLPLQKKGTIALVGPLHDAVNQMAGCWAVANDNSKYISLKQGMEKALAGKATLLTAQGCNLHDNADMIYSGWGDFKAPVVPVVDQDKAIAEAVQIARRADVVICAMGESSNMNGEGNSRADLEMPATQRDLLKALAKTGKPIVLVNFSGRAVVLKWEAENIPAIMQVWYGSEIADALPEVLFGEVAPQGRLTCSFPQNTGQVPYYYNHLNTGRPVSDDAQHYQSFASNYMDVRNAPLYPFGYGLTYTTFDYSDITLDTNEMKADESIEARITVTNSGSCDGVETVQLYIRDLEASLSRPVIELKGFQKVALKAGESKELTFTINAEMLKFYNYDLEHVLEPGNFDLFIGKNCRETKTAKFAVTE